MKNTHPELLIFHVPNGGNRNIAEAQKFKRMGVVPGVADFILVVPGIAVAIELKDEDGKQSEAQEKFQNKWEACGNRYRLVRSLEQFQNVVGYYAMHTWPWALHNQNPSP